MPTNFPDLPPPDNPDGTYSAVAMCNIRYESFRLGYIQGTEEAKLLVWSVDNTQVACCTLSKVVQLMRKENTDEQDSNSVC